jgi:sugar-specific transcriptional regulator TrmB
MLQAVGLNEFQERVYRTLLRFPTLSSADLGTKVEAGPARVRQALARLQELGLLRPAGRGRYVPVSPDSALSMLVNRREAELNNVRSAIEELRGDFQAGQLVDNPAGMVEVVTGAEAVRRRAYERDNACEEFLELERPPYVTRPELYDEIGHAARMAARGMRIRAIYSQEALARPGRMDVIQRSVALMGEARTLPELPVKLQMFDRRVAVLPLTGVDRGLESTAVIHPSGLLDALIALFESLWTVAAPVASANGALPDCESASHDPVLTLLGAGFKDEAIARHLKVSNRTARRRIAAVLDLVGGTTRFQAGVNASRQGRL